MADVLDFPKKIFLNHLIKDAIASLSKDNKSLKKCLELETTDLMELLKSIENDPPIFEFSTSSLNEEESNRLRSEVNTFNKKHIKNTQLIIKFLMSKIIEKCKH